jgi:hypothetical protein
MRGINWARLPRVHYRQIRRLTGLSVRCLVVAAILIIGSCPELLEMFPHRHLGVVAAGHDATPLEALEHLLHFETGSAHYHGHGDDQMGVSLVSPSHGSLLGLNILIPFLLTLMFISILIAELRLPAREAFAGCTWPPLSPPPRTTA